MNAKDTPKRKRKVKQFFLLKVSVLGFWLMCFGKMACPHALSDAASFANRLQLQASVIGSCQELPFGLDVFDASGRELSEAKGGFEDAKDGFSGLFSAFAEGFGGFRLQRFDHGKSPGYGDGFGSFGQLGWRFEVAEPWCLFARDSNPWRDCPRAQIFDHIFACLTRTQPASAGRVVGIVPRAFICSGIAGRPARSLVVEITSVAGARSVQQDSFAAL